MHAISDRVFVCYAPNFEEVEGTLKKLAGHIGFGLCVPACIRPFMHAWVLKFQIWIPHRKIADLYFFSCPSYHHFWSYAPLKKIKMKSC